MMMGDDGADVDDQEEVQPLNTNTRSNYSFCARKLNEDGAAARGCGTSTRTNTSTNGLAMRRTYIPHPERLVRAELVQTGVQRQTSLPAALRISRESVKV